MVVNKGIIYKATNEINNKSYIGKTIQHFEKYKEMHILSALKNNDRNTRYFYRAIRKYDKSVFIWEILFQDYCHQNRLNELEKFFIAYYNTFGKNGYNMTKGGDGGDTISLNPNKEEILIRRGNTCSKTLNKIDSLTGTTIHQGIIKKASKTKNKINPLTGLTINQEKALKRVETITNTIDEKTGLTIAQNIGRKSSKTIKERGSLAGMNNPKSKKFLLIAPNGQKIGCFGNAKKMCKKYNLMFYSLKRYLNKGKVKDGKYIGWEMILCQ